MPRELLESPGPILIVLRERDRELWERKRNRGMCKCIAAKAAFRNVIGWREREERKDGSAPTIFRKTPHPAKGDYSRSLKIRHFVFRMVPFASFFCSISHAGEKEKKERERETQPQKTRERWVWSSVWIRIPAVPQIEVEGRMGWVIRLIGTYLTITCRRLCLSFHFYFIERERVKERFSYIQYARNVMYVLTICKICIK